MRTRSAVLSIAALTTGVAAAVSLHRRADRSLPAPVPAAVPAVETAAVPADVAPDVDAVVLPFLRSVPAAPADEQPAAPARCGDTGGRTKAGTPCAARATTAGRCHHHRLAA